MNRRRRGITLIETILALSLITIAALGLIAALTRLMVAQSSSSHQTVARIIADSVLQRATLAGPPDFAQVSLGTVETQEVRVGQNSELVEFSYLVSAEEVTPPLSFSTPAGPPMGTMWEVTVTVWWNNTTAYEGAIERGTETIEVTTLTYIET
ncbi:MAG: prepilin-type N-terminal cleavage/methylation domain-containing protein [Candidatus Eremiobacteraeota bacterium]|nr:prepilin-type N-terminal cleavage/methylation domain-containing protein [Candidatus Eremiobacteraeota bacterium]